MDTDKITDKMQQEKISLYELQKLTKISYSTLHDILVTHKTKNPRVETVCKIAKSLGMDISELLGVM
ncbi:MAG: helix-turn-helix transcriptional regulator [Clostridium sp.]